MDNTVFKTPNPYLAAYLMTQGYPVRGLVPVKPGLYEMIFDAEAAQLIEEYSNGGLAPAESLLKNHAKIVRAIKETARIAGVQIRGNEVSR